MSQPASCAAIPDAPPSDTGRSADRPHRPLHIAVALGSTLLLLLGALVFATACAVLTGLALAASPPRHAPPVRAIVDGHHVQPRADQLVAPGRFDVTASQAREIDQLYRALTERSRGVVSGLS